MIQQIPRPSEEYILVGVAWPYVNGDLHPGHLGGYLMSADIFARYQRLTGKNVLMVSGSDCHGTPITLEADKQNTPPENIIIKHHARDIELFRQYQLSYNLYTKTTTKTHRKIVQEIFLKLLKNGAIIKDSCKQYYCADENKFLPDRYVEGTCPHCEATGQRSDQCENCGRWLKDGELIEPISKNTGNPVELRESEHYFLDLEGLSGEIRQFVDTKKDTWKRWVWSESLGWIEEGLRPRAITRDLDWGIELPLEEISKLPEEKRLKNPEGKRIYVWFEAVIGYLSASIEWSELHKLAHIKKQDRHPSSDVIFSRNEVPADWHRWWKNAKSKHYYFMGQDNLVFHTIMWPGQLIALQEDYTLPHNVVVNKFMNFDGKKFSKSKGHTIDTLELAKKYGVDEVRFAITSILPENKSSNFTYDGLEESINNELVAVLGNLLNRSLKFIKNRFNGNVSLESYEINPEVNKAISQAFTRSQDALDRCRFAQALNEMMELARFGNRYVEEKSMWQLKVESINDTGKAILLDILNIIANLTVLMSPFVPGASQKLSALLGFDITPQIGKNYWNIRIENRFNITNEVEPLFKKVYKPKET